MTDETSNEQALGLERVESASGSASTEGSGSGEVDPDLVSETKHPARTVVPVLPGDDADSLHGRYPWFVPEIMARDDADAVDRPRRANDPRP